MSSYSEGRESAPLRRPNLPEGPRIVADDLVVHYGQAGGTSPGLQGFSATFAPGITGLVGTNGAGKTTFLRSACGLMPATSGHIEIQGMPPAAYVAHHGIGFLPESPVLPTYLTVREFLMGLPPYEVEAREGERERAGEREARWILLVEKLLDTSLHALSLGQRKKVALAAALKGSPHILLLDEPTNGLDPLAERELRQTLREEQHRGITIVVSSHHLDELQRVADALVFVRDGRVAGAWSRTDALAGFPSLEALFDHVFAEGET